MLVKLKPEVKLPQESKLQPMIQLDALRAIAVFGVLVAHWLPKHLFLNSNLASGQLGVKLFFVLSGFLITLLLLQYRKKIDDGKKNIGLTIRRFYLRRLLRIFPIYYLTILLIGIFYLPGHPSLVWHLTYTSNIYYSLHPWDINSQFWSLAIEFQFYLVWPFLILLFPQKHLEKLIVSTIMIAPLFRLLCVAMGLSEEIRMQLLIPGCLDSLGLGALLAFYNYNPHRSRTKKLLCNLGFWIGGTLSLAIALAKPQIDPGLRLVIQDSINAFFFFWVIERAARGFGGIAGMVLEFKPLAYLGKISYGIYIYHSFVAAVIVPNSLSYLGFSYPKSIGIKFVLNTVTTVIVAMLSWQYIEQPINNLKRHFKI
jgi:peptidoglycan/LPS O-acetylase OafA/YrhL